MNNQFFYKQQLTETIDRLESFNLADVIRTVEVFPGQLALLLNDSHEEVREEPIMGKNNKYTLQKRKIQTFTDITLSVKDSARFKRFTDIDGEYEFTPAPEVKEEEVSPVEN